MNLQYGLFIFVGSGFVILVASVSDNPKITKTNGEFNPFNDELIKTDIVRHSLLGHGNCRTIKDLEDIRKALQDLSNKNIAGPIVDGEPLETLKRLPRYEAVAGAPEKLSILNINLRDYLFQTDILASAEEIRELTASLESRQKRKATSLPKKRWPVRGKGVIPYRLDASLSSYKRSIIAQSIGFWEENTCVKFQLHGKGIDKDSINFYSGEGCYSFVGKDSPNQDLSIGDGCEYFGIVTHEIAHALGFYHEQERYDRDKHVQVVFGNIAPINQLQFQLVKAMNLYGIPYDFGSVMHYEPDAFAINPRIPTIRAKNGEFQQTMGQGRGPSFLDVLEMNRHYKCLDACRKSTTKCLNGGYPNPNNCRVCKCPAGFGGRFCQGLQPSTEGENCGGILNAKYEWQSFSASLGTRVLVDTPTTCYWHIKAPVYTNIQVKITHLRTTCAAGCFYAALELKTDAQFVQSGHTHCCVTDNIHRIYKSKTNLVPVIGYANLALSFTIQYRQDVPSATSPPARASSKSPSTFISPPLTIPSETNASVEPTSPSETTVSPVITTSQEVTTPSVEEPVTEAEISTENPCPINGSWSAWSPVISPVDCCGFCAQTQQRICESTVIGCPCNGPDIKRIDCNNNKPCPATAGPECCFPWTKTINNGISVCELKLN